jgi:asparagine N-glycosylation enzyme membrane subunit Stt3
MPCGTGRVIHEFDPWFNFRATEYMVENGWEKFQVSNLRIK